MLDSYTRTHTTSNFSKSVVRVDTFAALLVFLLVLVLVLVLALVNKACKVYLVTGT